MRKIRTGDEVLVTTGRNKGQRGKVRVNLMERDRVVIEGVNIVKKHVKRGRARQAGIVEVEAPLHVSNVKLICPNCGQPTRVGVRKDADDKNERYCKHEDCGKTIPRPAAA
jgi:large subunit ribosomal protein L24